MNQQYLQYIREELMIATADLSGSTKGQIVALAENCMFTNERFPRKQMKVEDPVTKKLVPVWNQPVPGKQSRAKGKTIVPLLQIEYSTASWRRAVSLLPAHQRAWIRWCYAADMDYNHQVNVVQWGWEEFTSQLTGKLARKTKERLRVLIWLAAQDVKAGLAGRETYQYQELAGLIGVTTKNWSETFTERWQEMKRVFAHLDRDALLLVVRSRSQQKTAIL